MKKIIALAADHAGYELKNQLRAVVEADGWEVLDFGASNPDSVDYPDFAQVAAKAVTAGRAQLGVLVCGSGTGMMISANKIPGIRAANCWNTDIARLAREHNDANVLCLPARFVSESEAAAIVQAFLSAEFQGGRHVARVNKIEGNC